MDISNQNMSMTNIEIIDRLKKATNGLLFGSESEFPFEVFCWESPDLIPLTAAKLLQQTGHGSDTPIEMVTVDDFFQVATTEQEWHSPEEKAVVKQNQMLVDTLKNCLRDIKVYRLSTIEIDVYIVGITPSGSLAGIATKVVET